jgi:protein-disulfide isomerase
MPQALRFQTFPFWAFPFRPVRLVLALTGALVIGGYFGPAQAQSSPQSSAPAESRSAFTPEQRAEIVRILRDALQRDPSILRDAITVMQADDAKRQDETTRAAIVAQHDALYSSVDPSVGDPKADVTIIEFFDTRCPYCRRLEPTMANFLNSDSRVRLVYKDMPILGPASVLGSRALLAAQRQGGYDKLRTAIMQAPPDTTIEMIQQAAEAAGLDWNRLHKDMDDPAVQARLDANVRLARELGIQGTPALVIGEAMIPGAVDVADIKQAVAEARATAKN